MPRYIVRLEDAGVPHYLEYSTIVDAPVTSGMPLLDFLRYYRDEYGAAGLRDLPARLGRADRRGVSWHRDGGVEDLILCNRAGEGETRLTLEQIVDHYVRGNPLATGDGADADEEPEPEDPR